MSVSVSARVYMQGCFYLRKYSNVNTKIWYWLFALDNDHSLPERAIVFVKLM